MDTLLGAEVKQTKKKKRIFWFGILLLFIAIGVYAVRSSLNTTIPINNVTIGIVDRGTIENTIPATGEILPEFEQVMSSPVDASIQKVILDQGANVKAGNPIIMLDKSATESEYAKQKFQLESRKNDIEKLKLELSKTFYDVTSNNNIKQLHINSLAATLEDERRLYKAGGATKEDVSHAELNLKVAELEKKQIENEIRSKQQTMQLQIKEAMIAANIQQNDLETLGKKLQLANIVATRDGVITWVNKNIGATVKQGEVLAKVADLGSFKVSGTISDSYLDKLKNGMPVIIKVNDSNFRGTVSSISPSVQNAVINFNVQLDVKTDKLYRPNMKVEMYLVTNIKQHVLRVPNGPAFKGSEVQDVFVVGDHGKAVRKTVHTGMSNFDFVEVDNTLQEGDKVITSDMSEYKNIKEIFLKK